jgi:hypothetical protein
MITARLVMACAARSQAQQVELVGGTEADGRHEGPHARRDEDRQLSLPVESAVEYVRRGWSLASGLTVLKSRTMTTLVRRHPHPHPNMWGLLPGLSYADRVHSKLQMRPSFLDPGRVPWRLGIGLATAAVGLSRLLVAMLYEVTPSDGATLMGADGKRAGSVTSRWRSCLALAIFLAMPAWADARPPNVVFILADDLGYGDIGPYGQARIRTPRLDRMAREGTRFTQFYAGSPVCAPSRSALMTGQHTGHTYIRGNKEHPAGQEPLPGRRDDGRRPAQSRRLRDGDLRQVGSRRTRTRKASRHATASTSSSATTTSAARTSTTRSTCIATREGRAAQPRARGAAQPRAPGPAVVRGRYSHDAIVEERWPSWTGTARGPSSSTSRSPSRMRSCRRRTRRTVPT